MGVRTDRGADRGGRATDLEELVKLYVPQYNWGAFSGFGGGGGGIFRAPSGRLKLSARGGSVHRH